MKKYGFLLRFLASIRFYFFSMSIAFLMLLGCDGSWTTVQSDTPWVAPGVQATEQSKTVSNTFKFSSTGPSKIVVWVDSGGNHHHKRGAFESSDNYLESSGVLAKWSKEYSKTLAPFNFTIVSIVPTVIIMEPSGKSNLAVSSQPYIASMKLANDIQHGTTLSTSENLEWFSPDLKQGPSPITFSPQGVAEIPLTTGKLVLTQQGNQVKVTRE